VPIVEVGFAGLPGVPNAADALVWVGPGISVEIGFDPATFAALAGIPIPAPAPGAVAPAPIAPQVVLALIDTGAQQSMIDEALAIQLALPLINRQPYSGVGGPGIANVYLAHEQYRCSERRNTEPLWALSCKLAGKPIWL